jgi:hypothetical protein
MKTGNRIQNSEFRIQNSEDKEKHYLFLFWLLTSGFWLLYLSACSTQLNEIFSTQLTENYALASNGAIASDPSINDGKASTFGHSQGEEREFVIDFDQERHVRKVIIINDNLFRFALQYWDDNRLGPTGQRGTWRTAYEVRQRGGTEPGSEVVVPKFEIRTNFKSKKVRVIVSRSIDDKTVGKYSVDQDDKVVDRRMSRNLFGQMVVVYRVLVEAPAKIWEIEAYGLVKRE